MCEGRTETSGAQELWKRKKITLMISAGKIPRLDEVQAAVLKVSMVHLQEGNAWRKRIAGMYMEGIENPLVRLPETRNGAEHVYHVFPLLCEKREELQRYLLDKGIHTLIHYPIRPICRNVTNIWDIEKGSIRSANLMPHRN